MKEKRYLATAEFYVFETDDDIAEMMARSIAKDIAQKHDGSCAVVVKLQRAPFGRAGLQEQEQIKLKA